MLQEDLLNNVMERYSNEFEEDTYRRISRIFVEEHLNLLKTQEKSIRSQIESVSKILKSLQNTAA
jgi:hypothetical protein